MIHESCGRRDIWAHMTELDANNDTNVTLCGDARNGMMTCS